MEAQELQKQSPRNTSPVPRCGRYVGIEEAYRTGRAKIKVRAVTDIEPMQNGKNRIVVTELPYMVNKARLIEKIAELARDKKIDGITDLRVYIIR